MSTETAHDIVLSYLTDQMHSATIAARSAEAACTLAWDAYSAAIVKRADMSEAYTAAMNSGVGVGVAENRWQRARRVVDAAYVAYRETQAIEAAAEKIAKDISRVWQAHITGKVPAPTGFFGPADRA